jgi:hypothetical protein
LTAEPCKIANPALLLTKLLRVTLAATKQATPYATGALALWRHANAKKFNSGRQALDAAKKAFITTAAPIKLANDTRFAHSVVQAGAGGLADYAVSGTGQCAMRTLKGIVDAFFTAHNIAALAGSCSAFSAARWV